MIHIIPSFTYKIHIKNGYNTKISVIYLLTNLNITKNFYFLYIWTITLSPSANLPSLTPFSQASSSSSALSIQ